MAEQLKEGNRVEVKAKGSIIYKHKGTVVTVFPRIACVRFDGNMHASAIKLTKLRKVDV